MPAYSLGGQSAWAATTHTPQTFTAPKTFLAGAAGEVPIVVKAATGQTANIQEWQDAAGTVHAAVHATGRLQGFNGVTATAGTPEGTALSVQGAPSQTMDLTRWLDSAGSTLSSVKSDGVFSINVLNVGSYLTTSAGNIAAAISARSASDRPLVVRGATSQTANLQEWQDSAGTLLARLTNAGRLVVETAAYFGPDAGNTVGTEGAIRVLTSGAAGRGIVVRGVAGQTGDLIRLESDGGGVATVIGATGQYDHYSGNARFRIGAIGDYGTMRTFNDSGVTGLTGRWLTYAKDSLGNETIYTDIRHLVESPTDGAESGYTDFYTTSAGALRATFRVGQATQAAHLWTNLPGTKGYVVRAAAAQTANLFEAQNSAGTILHAVNSSGRLYFNQLDSTNAVGTFAGSVVVMIQGTSYRLPIYNV